jgi:hypothetical protein
VNLGSINDLGVDIAVNYNHPLGNMGTLGVTFIGRGCVAVEIERSPGAARMNAGCLYGINKVRRAEPRVAHKLRFNWSMPWNVDAGVTWRVTWTR